MAEPTQRPFRAGDLKRRNPLEFTVAPDAPARAALAAELGIPEIRKLRFSGTLVPEGTRDWRLDAKLGATVVQPCVVTLEPVVTRIDEVLLRRYLTQWSEPEPGSEIEMPDDDTIEPLGAEIDPAKVMAEALALALPDFPRAKGAELGTLVVTEKGVEPLTDEQIKPFAGLEKLLKDAGKS